LVFASYSSDIKTGEFDFGSALEIIKKSELLEQHGATEISKDICSFIKIGKDAYFPAEVRGFVIEHNDLNLLLINSSKFPNKDEVTILESLKANNQNLKHIDTYDLRCKMYAKAIDSRGLPLERYSIGQILTRIKEMHIFEFAFKGFWLGCAGTTLNVILKYNMFN
jgi:hypothetical protein